MKKRGSKSERMTPCRSAFHRLVELCSFSRPTARAPEKKSIKAPEKNFVRKWIEGKIGRAIVLSIVLNDFAPNNKFIRANRASNSLLIGSSVLIVSWAGENEIII